MVQGTTSDAGKSTLVAGLCRVLSRAGVAVVPFKPQNMALNSAVTVDGGEIGRAQALQALAARVPAHTDMNPVLLKPNSDTGAQVVIHGQPLRNMDAREYHAFKPEAMHAVMASYQRLRRQFDVVLVEGAGSPAEVNLREGDIANMGFAMAAGCAVVIVADIDRGGVFAHLLGTLECLAPEERARVTGFVINRFRGDPALLAPGIEWLETRTGKPVLGVVPYLQGLHLDAEDAMQVGRTAASRAASCLRVTVPVFPRISNHTDFDALRAHPQVEVTFVGPGQALPAADLVVLPGSKNVQSDLQFLRAQGWDRQIERHLRYGGKLIGVCGGMQMLGHAVHDPLGIEGSPASMQGLGWLDIETALEARKQLRMAEGRLAFGEGGRVRGYEIHMGATRGDGLVRPAMLLGGGPDGAISSDGQVLGTYLHGLFDHAEGCRELLSWAGLENPEGVDHAERREMSLQRLADALEAHIDLERLAATFAKVRHPAAEAATP